MLYAAIKAILSGILIAVVSETAKRNAALGALIASLPILSVIAMVWLWRDTGDSERIAAHAQSTFWYVLPSLPMFLVLPVLLRSGMHFYLALGLSCALTVLLYLTMIWALKQFGVTL